MKERAWPQVELDGAAASQRPRSSRSQSIKRLVDGELSAVPLLASRLVLALPLVSKGKQVMPGSCQSVNRSR